LDQLTGLATLETDRLRIIQRAEYHRACMQGLSREAMLDYLEGVFEACPIVTGVFPRADELVIVFLKGGGDLLQAAAAGRCFPIGPLEAGAMRRGRTGLVVWPFVWLAMPFWLPGLREDADGALIMWTLTTPQAIVFLLLVAVLVTLGWLLVQ
jgi:hypothetical protein